MPPAGRQRTKQQKAHTAAMGKQRWSPKPNAKAEIIDPANHRLLSLAQKELKKEKKKVKQLEYNYQRREKTRKIREELKQKELQDQVQAATEAAEEKYEGRLEEWRKEKECLKKNVARLNARDRREPLRTEHAVQKAIEYSHSASGVQQNIRYVKDKQGIVQNWARDAILRLVNLGVPMSKMWEVTKVDAEAYGVVIVGTWSTRTSRRVVREGGIAAGLMIVEYVLTCIGQ